MCVSPSTGGKVAQCNNFLNTHNTHKPYPDAVSTSQYSRSKIVAQNITRNIPGTSFSSKAAKYRAMAANASLAVNTSSSMSLSSSSTKPLLQSTSLTHSSSVSPSSSLSTSSTHRSLYNTRAQLRTQRLIEEQKRLEEERIKQLVSM